MAIKNVILSIAIIILTISAMIYGIHTFYDRPAYEDYCSYEKPLKLIENIPSCDEINGTWREGYCDLNYECEQKYDEVMEVYSRNMFLVALPLGILIIVLGAVIFGLETVGAGLMGGGVGLILYGVMEYWRYSANLLRFVLSLAGLVVVIWFTYWLNKKK